MKIDVSTAIVNGKINAKKLADAYRAVADQLESGALVAIGLDAGSSALSGNEWYKVIIQK